MGTAHLTSVEAARLRCPYCGRAVPADTDWVTTGQRAWGSCGFAVDLDGRRVAALLLAPDTLTRDARNAPDSRNAQDSQDEQRAIIMGIWVDQAYVRRGLGKRLIQAACAGLRGRDVRVLVARAGIQPTCATPPRGFLRRCGFVWVPAEQEWVLDLDATVTDRAGAPGMLHRIVASLRPVSPSAPVARTERRMSAVVR